MKYFFIKENYRNRSIRVVFDPENRVLTGAFFLIKDKELPTFIRKILLGQGFGKENMSILFFHEMDWEDKANIKIEKGELRVYFYDGKPSEIVLNEQLFMRIVLDYSKKVLEVYEGDEGLGAIWIKLMQVGIEKLANKLKLES